MPETDALKRHNQTLVQWVLRQYKFDLVNFSEEQAVKIMSGDVDRAGADVICPHCGNKYLDHPGIKGELGLVVTCDWKVYKL